MWVVSGRVVLLGLAAACGRLGFDASHDAANQPPFDGGADASPCINAAVDWASWPMPNDPGSGLPNTAMRDATAQVVTDRVTGLEWERDAAAGIKTWANAKTYCAALARDGGCWRMPERIELASIVDYSAVSPSIDPLFTSTASSAYWTATAVTNDPGRRWVVTFDLGYIQRAPETDMALVRCVRGPQDPLPRYQVSQSGTVLDTKTGLTWQQTVVGTYTWNDARTYCATLPLDGGGWRSPSIQELETLVDTSQPSLLVDASAFPGTPASLFWSGSGIQNDATMGWTIDFTQGYAFRPITAMLPTRCVR